MARKRLNKKKFIASHDFLNKAIDYKTIAVVLNAANSKLENKAHIGLKLPQVGEAQLEAHLPQPPQLQKLRCGLVFKICCALIALYFQKFFRLIAQFYTLNLILFNLDCNIDHKYRPSLTYCLLVIFCLIPQKMRCLHCVFKIQLRKLGCTLTWYENPIPQLQNCVALQLNQKVYCGSCAALQKLKKIRKLRILRCAFTG